MSNLAAAPLALSSSVQAVCCYRDKLLVSHGDPCALSVYPRQHADSGVLSTQRLKRPALHLLALTKVDCVLLVDGAGLGLWRLQGDRLAQIDRVDAQESVGRPIAISVDECRAVTGSDSGLLEVWALGADKIIQEASYKALSEKVTGVSISRDQELIAALCEGEFPGCRVVARSSGQVVHTLYFSEHEGEPNFRFKGCCFARTGDLLYTCQSLPHCPSYLTQWDVHADFAPVSTHKLHVSEATEVALSPLGFTLAVGTESGTLLTVNTRTMGIESVEDLLPSRVTCLGFSTDGRVISAGAADGSLKCVHNQYMVGLFAKSAKGWILFLMFAWVYFYLTS